MTSVDSNCMDDMEKDLLDFLNNTEIGPEDGIISEEREAQEVILNRISNLTRYVLYNVKKTFGNDILMLLSSYPNNKEEDILYDRTDYSNDQDDIVANKYRSFCFPIVLNAIAATLKETVNNDDPVLHELCIQLIRWPTFTRFGPYLYRKEQQIILDMMEYWENNITIEIAIIRYMNQCIETNEYRSRQIDQMIGNAYKTFFRNYGYPFAIHLMEKYPTNVHVQGVVMNLFTDFMTFKDRYGDRIDVNDLLHSLAFDSVFRNMKINSKDSYIQHVGLHLIDYIFTNTDCDDPQLPGQLSNITDVAILILNVVHIHEEIKDDAFKALKSVLKCYYDISEDDFDYEGIIQFDPEKIIQHIPLMLDAWQKYQRRIGDHFVDVLWFLLKLESTPTLIKTIINAQGILLLLNYLKERLQGRYPPLHLCEIMQKLIETEMNIVVMHSKWTKGVLSDLLQSSLVYCSQHCPLTIQDSALYKLAMIKEIHKNRLPLHCLVCFRSSTRFLQVTLRQMIKNFIHAYPQACLSKDAGGSTPLLLALKYKQEIAVIRALLEVPQGSKAIGIRDAKHRLPIEKNVPWETFEVLFNATRLAERDGDMTDNNYKYLLPPALMAAVSNANLSNIYTLVRHRPHSFIK